MKKRVFFILIILLTSMLFIACQAEDVADESQAEDTNGTESEESDSSDDGSDGTDGPPDEVTKWVFQPAFDSGDAGWANGVEPWIEDVVEATEGSIEIELLAAGSIVSGDEAFGAASDGTIDVYAGWATVYGGIMPEGMLAYGLAMGADDHNEAWEAMWGDPNYQIGEIVQEAAHENNLHWAGWTSQGPNSIFTKFPINSMEDLEGKKLRAGGPQAIFLETMGGTPVSLGGDEIYTAIDLGTIEGTMWDTGGISSMKFHEVIDYAMMPGWNAAQHQEIYINLDSWNALTDWQREQIEGIFESNYFKTSEMHLEGVEESLKALEDSGGEVITLSDEEVEKMRQKAINEIWPKVAEESERTAQGVELWKQYLRDKGKIE